MLRGAEGGAGAQPEETCCAAADSQLLPHEDRGAALAGVALGGAWPRLSREVAPSSSSSSWVNWPPGCAAHTRRVRVAPARCWCCGGRRLGSLSARASRLQDEQEAPQGKAVHFSVHAPAAPPRVLGPHSRLSPPSFGGLSWTCGGAVSAGCSRHPGPPSWALPPAWRTARPAALDGPSSRGHWLN